MFFRCLSNNNNYHQLYCLVLSRPTRKSDLVMPDQARAIAKELGVYYYETSVLTYYGVNEVFENAIRAALIARRQQRFWMTNLKKVQRPLLQVSCI